MVLLHHQKGLFEMGNIYLELSLMRNECVKYNQQFLRCENWGQLSIEN